MCVRLYSFTIASIKLFENFIESKNKSWKVGQMELHKLHTVKNKYICTGTGRQLVTKQEDVEWSRSADLYLGSRRCKQSDNQYTTCCENSNAEKKWTKGKCPICQNHCCREPWPQPCILHPHNLHLNCACRSLAHSAFTPPLSPVSFDVPCC